MLVIDPEAFGKACEALMIAARQCRDADGLRVITDLPRLPHGSAIPKVAGEIPDDRDYHRVRSITLGAIVALTNSAAYPGDEIPLAGFRSPKEAGSVSSISTSRPAPDIALRPRQPKDAA